MLLFVTYFLPHNHVPNGKLEIRLPGVLGTDLSPFSRVFSADPISDLLPLMLPALVDAVLSFDHFHWASFCNREWPGRDAFAISLPEPLKVTLVVVSLSLRLAITFLVHVKATKMKRPCNVFKATNAYHNASKLTKPGNLKNQFIFFYFFLSWPKLELHFLK